MLRQQAKIGFAQGLQCRRVGADDHAVAHLGSATGNRPRLAINFHQAKAAAAVGLEAVIVAQMRHIGASGLQRVQQAGAGRDFNEGAIIHPATKY